jgi:hypothetical protein
MKSNLYKWIIFVILILVVSCDEPETIVTNFVHPDGSVTRRIEMRNSKNLFEPKNLQVPFDSTWVVRNTTEISKKGDTTWIKTAEKLFKNTDEINLTYKKDSGANKEASRSAGFNKKFKWFNTNYRFSETIDKRLACDYLVKDFLNEEELLYFYSPENIRNAKEQGSDSLKFRALKDSVDHKVEIWTIKVFISEWISEFAKLTEGKAGNELTLESLKKREGELLRIVMNNIEKFDTLWQEGIMLKEMIGEDNALRFKTDADTAMDKTTDKVLGDFKDYSVRIMMTGKLIGTNGFIDSSQVLLWPVSGDYFLTEPYEMWAESKMPNIWAWIVSGFFLLFVFTGVILRIIKKG